MRLAADRERVSVISQNESELVREARLAARRERISVARLTIFPISHIYFFKYIRNINHHNIRFSI